MKIAKQAITQASANTILRLKRKDPAEPVEPPEEVEEDEEDVGVILVLNPLN